eukprot:Hpha_TRINITY_DN16191_c6_g1::TRINITY_DN16191_c6_g1_i1::g.4933::m.4933
MPHLPTSAEPRCPPLPPPDTTAAASSPSLSLPAERRPGKAPGPGLAPLPGLFGSTPDETGGGTSVTCPPPAGFKRPPVPVGGGGHADPGAWRRALPPPPLPPPDPSGVLHVPQAVLFGARVEVGSPRRGLLRGSKRSEASSLKGLAGRWAAGAAASTVPALPAASPAPLPPEFADLVPRPRGTVQPPAAQLPRDAGVGVDTQAAAPRSNRYYVAPGGGEGSSGDSSRSTAPSPPSTPRAARAPSVGLSPPSECRDTTTSPDIVLTDQLCCCCGADCAIWACVACDTKLCRGCWASDHEPSCQEPPAPFMFRPRQGAPPRVSAYFAGAEVGAEPPTSATDMLAVFLEAADDSECEDESVYDDDSDDMESTT